MMKNKNGAVLTAAPDECVRVQQMIALR